MVLTQEYTTPESPLPLREYLRQIVLQAITYRSWKNPFATQNHAPDAWPVRHCGPENGCINEEDLKKLYDGPLFYEIREKRNAEDGWRESWGLGGDGLVGDVKVLPFSF
ncbi:uncharacterized protein FIBRA_08956 [Fibroporia radiculosa]|uniref:Uncharacterized protein n=1 Tax=Fibroporia radiculosa TaxID=599839 RepID=J4ICM5_9APHY|nr:uncharacterized protein FIBRA_08956 [Fibroporia radiculosa]CCM06671.1 predicted protein [Fibroporia radiculosa]